MKKLLALILSVTMVLSLLTGLTLSASAEATETPSGTVTLTELVTDGSLGWVVTNNLSSNTFNPYYDHTMTVTMDGFESYSLIQTKRYEPAGEPHKTSWYKSNVSGTVANITVDNSCEVYVLFPIEASSSCGKWILDNGYTSLGTVSTSAGTSFYAYKKAVTMYDGQTSIVPLGCVNSNWFNQMCSFAVKWVENPKAPAKTAYIEGVMADKDHMEMLNENAPETFMVKHYVSVAELRVTKQIQPE